MQYYFAEETTDLLVRNKGAISFLKFVGRVSSSMGNDRRF